MVCLLFNQKVSSTSRHLVLAYPYTQGQAIASAYHNKAFEDSSIRQRNKGLLSFESEYLIALGQIPETVHSILCLVRPVTSELESVIDFNFSIECAAVKNLNVANYQANVLTTFFNLEFHVPESDDPPNIYIINKLYRDSSNAWNLHLIRQEGIAVNTLMDSVVEVGLVHLMDIYPDLKNSATQTSLLSSTEEICAALSSDEFCALETYFANGGVKKSDFIRILLRQLLLTRPFLREEKKATEIAKVLSDLFEQIDINEDLLVDWEEFTSFCVMIGMISTNQQQLTKPTDLIHESYCQESIHGPKFDPHSITNVRYLKPVEKVAVLQIHSVVIAIYSTEGKFLHFFTAVDKSLDVADPSVTDIEHIMYRSQPTYAVSCSSYYISLWTIINATRGIYVLVTRLATRETQLGVRWSGVLNTMLSLTVTKTMLVWELDKEKSTTWSSNAHSDYITDCVDVPNHNFIATCSLDKKIIMWNASTRQQAYVMRGHTLGIQHLDYARNILLSSGFEHQAYCWYVPNQKHSLILAGHNDQLIGAVLLTADPIILRCVTGDRSGKFKIWDISRCSKSTKSSALVLQHFTYDRIEKTITTRDIISNFCIVPECSSKALNQSFHDVLAAESTGLVRFRVQPRAEDLESPRNVIYNSVCHTFTGSVKRVVRIWDARTGEMAQDILEVPRGDDVSCMVYAQPRQRKLFVGTENGNLSMFNPVNGKKMTELTELHAQTITTMFYCLETQCLISTGKDGSVCVSRDIRGTEQLELIRTLDHAHE